MHPKRLIDLIEIVDSNSRLENIGLRQLRDPVLKVTDSSTDEFFRGKRFQSGIRLLLIDCVIQTDARLSIGDIHTHP